MVSSVSAKRVRRRGSAQDADWYENVGRKPRHGREKEGAREQSQARLWKEAAFSIRWNEGSMEDSETAETWSKTGWTSARDGTV
jgi:hypothetical protein